MIEVELLTRRGCGLCDEMKRALEQAAQGLEVRLKETDIDTDEALAASYGHDIPVLFVNGSKAFKHRASVNELRRRLRIAQKSGQGGETQ
jgi:glutaredoxin